MAVPASVHRHYRRIAVLALALLVALTALPAQAAGPYPNSMAALGDSITQAFNSGSFPLINVPANSWSTGTNSAVSSLYGRILAHNAAIRGRNFNFARSGDRVGGLLSQVNSAKLLRPEYVTILIGANDVCASSEAGMPSAQSFRDQFLAAVSSLASGSPQSRIYVTSIPNVYQLWAIFKDNPSARQAWSLYSTCQSMLANPTSLQQSDIDRRARVRQRNIDYNTQLREVCALFAQCRFDNNAVFNTAFVAADVSTLDYFHPSVTGQAKLAATAWAASGFAP